MTVRRRRHRSVSKPVVLPESPDIRRVKRLSMFGPGIPIRIPLHLLPAYLQTYELEPIGYREPSNTLLVRRVAKERSDNHEHQLESDRT